MSYADTQALKNPKPSGPNVQMRYAGLDYSQAITVSAANHMIQSYLNSINYTSNDTDLRSLTFDADTLRAYLANPNIKTVKFMLAHKQSYLDAGHYGKHAGNKAAAMTMVIVGLDEDDDYILNPKSMVYDHFNPCPTICSNSSALIQ